MTTLFSHVSILELPLSWLPNSLATWS